MVVLGKNSNSLKKHFFSCFRQEIASSRFSREWSSDGWSGDTSWKRGGGSLRGGRPGNPLHGRNDMKTSKKCFSRQKHAHKQRKKGLSCHHAPPLYIWTLQPAKSGPVPRMRYAQVRSGTIRYAQVLSETLCFNVQPPQEPRTPSIASTVFNGPVGPKSPKGPKDGCSPSIPITQSPNFP